jgi:hypothetical protein
LFGVNKYFFKKPSQFFNNGHEKAEALLNFTKEQIENKYGGLPKNGKYDFLDKYSGVPGLRNECEGFKWGIERRIGIAFSNLEELLHSLPADQTVFYFMRTSLGLVARIESSDYMTVSWQSRPSQTVYPNYSGMKIEKAIKEIVQYARHKAP